MDKNVLRNFALWARKRLMEQAACKVHEVLTERDEISDQIWSGDMYLTETHIKIKRLRQKLVMKIEEEGFDSLIDQVAYTCFNRAVVLRYMEANGCLTVLDRALSSCDKQLFISLCKKLHNMLPFIFEEIDDLTELLLPDNLWDEDSIIGKMVHYIGEEGLKEVEVLGWLYQYYISERKDEVFAALKNNVKISKENIPAATQLFTPKWIVKYLVENSIGRLYQESHGNTELGCKWKYYQDVAEQGETSDSCRRDVRKERKNLKPDEIKVLDPACGSGNMLVYAFDVLYDIYLDAGYEREEIPRLIITNNLYGLDIDDRAASLASFAVVMKARERNERILEQIKTEGIDINITSIKDTNHIIDAKDIIIGSSQDREYEKRQVQILFDTFFDAKEYGSILKVVDIDMDFWQNALKISEPILEKAADGEKKEHLKAYIGGLVKQAGIMQGKYHVVVTNPPYMGSNSMNSKLSGYINTNYNDSKADLYGAFIEKCLDYTKPCFYTAMITQQSWMFLSSFKDLREKLLRSNTIISALHLGSRAFEEIGGEVVQTVSFVLLKGSIKKYRPNFRRLTGCNSPYAKEEAYLSGTGAYSNISQEDFFKIPASPIAYWISSRGVKVFQEGTSLGHIGEPRQGLATADNERFLRLWYEVDINSIGFGCGSSKEFLQSGKKWAPFIKGGPYRKWYGNQEYVVDWEEDGFEIKEYISARYPYLKGNYRFVVKNESKYFNEGITWTAVGGSSLSLRYFEKGFIFSNAGMAVFETKMPLEILGALLNSRVSSYLLSCMRETFNFNQGDIVRLPVLGCEKYYREICCLFNENVSIAKEDWNSFETSWDFETHPLLTHRKGRSIIEEAFIEWKKHREMQFQRLKSNEEKLNRIFIDVYGLREEVSFEVCDSEVSVSRADLNRDVKSFISFGVGCILGRYSIDKKGLAYGGGLFQAEKYISFKPCSQGIIPLSSSQCFEEDIVSRFVEFLKTSFGEVRLSQNLEFIANALGRRKRELPADTLRRYFMHDFYRDHVKMYKKRPVYWLFTSGKEKGFSAFVYIHRLNRDTFGSIRTGYVHRLQKILTAEKAGMERLWDSGVLTQKSRKDAERKMGVIERQINEVEKYDELLSHFEGLEIEIDLNQGVKANYERLGKLLQKI